MATQLTKGCLTHLFSASLFSILPVVIQFTANKFHFTTDIECLLHLLASSCSFIVWISSDGGNFKSKVEIDIRPSLKAYHINTACRHNTLTMISPCNKECNLDKYLETKTWYNRPSLLAYVRPRKLKTSCWKTQFRNENECRGTQLTWAVKTILIRQICVKKWINLFPANHNNNVSSAQLITTKVVFNPFYYPI